MRTRKSGDPPGEESTMEGRTAIARVNEFAYARRRRCGAVLGALVAVVVYSAHLPALADTLAQADPHHPHFIRILRHGGEVEFFGEIISGATQELRAVLEANPEVKVIHLNSEGGSVREGRRMSALISQTGLAVVADTYCYSACVLAFLGGAQRYLSPDAALGFHHESGDHASASEVAASEKVDEDFMAGLGIPADFIKKAFSTPATGI